MKLLVNDLHVSFRDNPYGMVGGLVDYWCRRRGLWDFCRSVTNDSKHEVFLEFKSARIPDTLNFEKLVVDLTELMAMFAYLPGLDLKLYGNLRCAAGKNVYHLSCDSGLPQTRYGTYEIMWENGVVGGGEEDDEQ